MKTITSEELLRQREFNPDLQLIDVRTEDEFRDVHVDFAINVPLAELDLNALRSKNIDFNQPLYLICKLGGRSEKACHALIQAGIENVVNIVGGTDDCIEKSLPLSRGVKPPSDPSTCNT